MKTILFFTIFNIILGCASTKSNKLYGPIPNEEKAIEVAKLILSNTIHDKDIINYNFKVTNGNCNNTDSWVLIRILPKNMLGGDVYIEITKNEGKICKCNLGE